MKRWPLKTANFWESAPFFRILLPFVAGIICYDRGWLQSITFPVLFSIIVPAFIMYTCLLYIPKGKNIHPFIAFSLLHIFLFFSGFAVTYFSDIRNDKKWFGNNLHSTSLARITDMPIEKERSWKVPVTVINTIKDGKIFPAAGNAFLYLYKDNGPMLLHKGDTIMVPANWQPIKNSGNPFEFNYAAYCRRNNIFYRQSCSPSDVRLYSTNDPDKAPLLEMSHDWCMQQLDKNLDGPQAKGLVQAMLLGDEINLDEDLLQAYADTGIVHIIAISGGNVAIFFIAISVLLLWLKDKKHLWIKYVIALPLVWFYVLMAGAQPSAIRAAIMFSLLAFAVILQKNNNSLNQLLATAFFLLCAQPMWLYAVGFQLSFVAVLSLILFYKPVYKWLSPANKIASALWETAAASIAAEVLVAPLVIYYFHTFPLLFIISNVLAYIFMGFVLLMSIAIITAFFFPWLAKLFGIITSSTVTVFDKIIFHLQNYNPVSFHYLTLSTVELILVYTIIIGITLFLLKKDKKALIAGLALSCILLCSFCKDQWVRLRQQHLVVYNTGKSNHIEIINGKDYTVLGTDTLNKKTAYAVKPAHTFWQAWTEDTLHKNEIVNINGKTALILNNDLATDKQFPVDYLIVNYKGDVDPEKLQRIFCPSEIIIGNNYTGQEQDKLAQIASKNNIHLHIITRDGAFIR